MGAWRSALGRRGSNAETKRLVCLANSRKHGGHCVAGREWAEGTAGAWVRPVGARDDRAVSEDERRYAGKEGGEPQVQDVIEVPLLRPQPLASQPENWLLNPRRSWEKAGAIMWNDLASLVDPEAPLWTNGSSSHAGTNNRVAEDQGESVTDSLRLIHVDDLRLAVRFSEYQLRYEVNGLFSYGGDEYKLRVTDPDYEFACTFLKDPGEHFVGESYLTVSLGEPFEGYHYKLIAAIIRPTVLTVGHSSHEPAEFLRLLQTHNVTAVADVRSAPYSRYAQAFNREPLAQYLKNNGIAYVFLGAELGGRIDDPSCYDDKGRLQYREVAKKAVFEDGIERVIDGASRYRIALMCTEQDPLDCHRTLLVARALDERRVAVRHILQDGNLESYAQAVERMTTLPKVRDLPGPNQPRLDSPPHPRQMWIDECFRVQGQRVSFQDAAHESGAQFDTP